jgi:hypothetical protein
MDKILPGDDLATGEVLMAAIDPGVDHRDRVVLRGVSAGVAVAVAIQAEVRAGLSDAEEG